MTSRNIWLAGVAAGAIAMTGPAAAQSYVPQQGFYVGGAIGQSTFWDVDNIEFDLLGFHFSAIAGIRLSPNLRTEGELLYEFADIDDSNADIEVTRFLGSAYYDFAPLTLLGQAGIRPYMGAGGGFANVDVIDDDVELTVHGGVGASVPMASNFELVPGVRLSYTTLDGGGDDLWVTQFRVGMRYSF